MQERQDGTHIEDIEDRGGVRLHAQLEETVPRNRAIGRWRGRLSTLVSLHTDLHATGNNEVGSLYRE